MVTLDKESKDQIAQAIARAETRTRGEIRVHLKRRCGGDILAQAIKDFEKLGMHRTKDRSGVLIFIALESHAFAILGDKGIHEKV
ncbi:MAG TPA: TPM domain-containing protein, partial [Candidatus Omnitrophota bacterium]|nr:TPM domain-containing protein [Candidatus Omnitrophota bacterium]